jgi:hypothetical protein
MLRDGEEAMSIGKSFQTEAPATGKVRLPMVYVFWSLLTDVDWDQKQAWPLGGATKQIRSL